MSWSHNKSEKEPENLSGGLHYLPRKDQYMYLKKFLADTDSLVDKLNKYPSKKVEKKEIANEVVKGFKILETDFFNEIEKEIKQMEIKLSHPDKPEAWFIRYFPDLFGPAEEGQKKIEDNNLAFWDYLQNLKNFLLLKQTELLPHQHDKDSDVATYLNELISHVTNMQKKLSIAARPTYYVVHIPEDEFKKLSQQDRLNDLWSHGKAKSAQHVAAGVAGAALGALGIVVSAPGAVAATLANEAIAQPYYLKPAKHSSRLFAASGRKVEEAFPDGKYTKGIEIPSAWIQKQGDFSEYIMKHPSQRDVDEWSSKWVRNVDDNIRKRYKYKFENVNANPNFNPSIKQEPHRTFYIPSCEMPSEIFEHGIKASGPGKMFLFPVGSEPQAYELSRERLSGKTWCANQGWNITSEVKPEERRHALEVLRQQEGFTPPPGGLQFK